jgi:Beta-lactamase enzyme family
VSKIISRMCRWAILLLMSLFFSLAQSAQAAASPEYQQMAERLTVFLGDPKSPETLFDRSFLDQVPPAQIIGLASSLIAQHGKPVRLGEVEAKALHSGIVRVVYARANVVMQMAMTPAHGGKIIGLLVIAVRVDGDSAARLSADFRALKGNAGLVITQIANGGLRIPLLEYNADEPHAIASVFKLWVLAEAARQVNAGERGWDDVIPLGPRSMPSGITQAWPIGTPMTMQGLATLMISISDNTATDTLLHALGRRNVDAMVAQTGHFDAERTLPILSTIEAFALKMHANTDLREEFRALDSKRGRALLHANRARLTHSAVNPSELSVKPAFIDSIEWFASPNDMARLLDYFRRLAGREALSIMAVNVPLPEGEVKRFRYAGYKGGSEIGVMAMSFLIQAQNGDWYAVTGAWNNAEAAIDQEKFTALMQRAVALVP